MDEVLYWNEVALEVTRRDYTPNSEGDRLDTGPVKPEQPGPTRVSRGLAMVHIAIYEAYARCNPGALVPYAPLAAPFLASPTARPPVTATPGFTAGAISGAAASVLTSLWPRQAAYILEQCHKFQETFATAAFDDGRSYGDSVGKAVLRLRRMDGAEVADDPVYGLSEGRHRPDPFAPKQGRSSTNWGNVQPFSIAPAGAGAQIHTPYIAAHPARGRERYDAAVWDVQQEGSATGSTRTPWKTVAGIFWGYDGSKGLGVPPRLYNQVVRAFAKQYMAANSPAQNASLFALVNVGMADAAIVAWSAKYAYDLWRPVVGIRQHEAGFGHGTAASTGPTTPQCDPGWAPLGRPGTNMPGDFTKTPDFPAYPSGHATFGAVAFKLTALFYQKYCGVTFEKAFKESVFNFVSDEYNGVNTDPHGDTRPYHERELTLGYAVAENALSRVWLGVHWRFDGLGATLPADLEGIKLPRGIPKHPPVPAVSAQAKTTEDQKERALGGVPAGLKIADEVLSSGQFALANAKVPPTAPTVKLTPAVAKASKSQK